MPLVQDRESPATKPNISILHCPKCQSVGHYVGTTMPKSPDEPVLLLGKCLVCNHKWRV